MVTLVSVRVGDTCGYFIFEKISIFFVECILYALPTSFSCQSFDTLSLVEYCNYSVCDII